VTNRTITRSDPTAALQQCTRLGECLRYLGCLTREQCEAIAGLDDDSNFGQRAIALGLVSPGDLSRAVVLQAAWRTGGVRAVVAAWADLVGQIELAG
jgi:hypothetical protein